MNTSKSSFVQNVFNPCSPIPSPTDWVWIRKVELDSKDDRSQVYLPEKCIGCGTCIAACPKGALVIGSVGAVARGLIDKDFIEKRKGELRLLSTCSRVCPSGALEVRTRGFAETDESYQQAGIGTGDSGTHFTSFFNISKARRGDHKNH
jgi:ferredoxin